MEYRSDCMNFSDFRPIRIGDFRRSKRLIQAVWNQNKDWFIEKVTKPSSVLLLDLVTFL